MRLLRKACREDGLLGRGLLKWGPPANGGRPFVMLHRRRSGEGRKIVKSLWIFLKICLTFPVVLLYNGPVPVKGHTAMMREIARPAR